jgi:ribosomal protein L31E
VAARGGRGDAKGADPNPRKVDYKYRDVCVSGVVSPMYKSSCRRTEARPIVASAVCASNEKPARRPSPPPPPSEIARAPVSPAEKSVRRRVSRKIRESPIVSIGRQLMEQLWARGGHDLEFPGKYRMRTKRFWRWPGADRLLDVKIVKLVGRDDSPRSIT